jgi:hypothetical protein
MLSIIASTPLENRLICRRSQNGSKSDAVCCERDTNSRNLDPLGNASDDRATSLTRTVGHGNQQEKKRFKSWLSDQRSQKRTEKVEWKRIRFVEILFPLTI